MAQTTNSCCGISSTSKFSALGNNTVFIDAHVAPLRLSYSPESNSSVISFKTPDGKEGKAFKVKSHTPTSNIIFLIHEWWGLNDYIKREAVKLQQELGEVTIYALDLYDGKIATNAKDASAYMQSVDEERARAIIQGAIEMVGAKAHIATIGWCFGGGWSLQSSLMAGKQAIGCVMYYGMPENDTVKLKTLQTNVLGIFASKDEWITPVLVKDFEKNMKALGKNLEVKMYDAVHAFANPSNPQYDKIATEHAHKEVITFFKKQFIIKE